MITEPTDIQLRVSLDRTWGFGILERAFTTSGLLITVIHRGWIEAVDVDGNVVEDVYVA